MLSDTDQQALLRTIMDLIRFRTVDGEFAEFDRTVEYVRRFFQGTPVHITEHRFNNYPALVLTTRQTTHPRIFLQGHLDVVPGESAQFSPKIKGDRLYGRGSVDMKGFDALAMHLLRELALHQPDADVGLMFTFDEEIGGANGAARLAEMGYGADMIINGDGGYNHAVIFAEKGILKIRICTEAIPGRHPYPWQGENAFDVLIRNYQNIISLFPEQWKATEEDNWYSTYSVYDVKVENKMHSPPHRAEMKMNFYFTEPVTPDELLEKIRLHARHVSIEKVSGSERVYLDPNNSAIRELRDIMEKHFRRPIAIRSENGSSDARFFTRLGVPILIVKVVGEDHHGPREHLVIPELMPLYRSLEEFIQRHLVSASVSETIEAEHGTKR